MTQTQARTVFLLAHTGRPAAVRSAELVVKGLLHSGIGVRVLEAEARDLPLPDEVELVKEATPQCLDGCELLIVLGGDDQDEDQDSQFCWARQRICPPSGSALQRSVSHHKEALIEFGLERAPSKAGNRSSPGIKAFHSLSLPLCHFLDDEGQLDIRLILGDTAILGNRSLTD